ncbi:RNA degradosome polyphosphate kinase [Sulfurovum sp. bin170]|uniref:RNA degradosome polyphosphate kinase n=1 Tax=Sulfurovum sp. bin170 TaxID=2695268 RepID=UPI0013DE8A04|nr:RNA degradosome polyphosphate kinase [Sulfurovum sp. bin170]NEW61018.1 RNA degradosome polyphosphate kinase [Sulfurovum sp. bin170]
MPKDLTSPDLYFNRELSWLKFNTRVLAQAKDSSLPPLERMKFIAIYGTNLDEFYMIRVAGLKALFKARIQETAIDKMTPTEQLEAIHKTLHREQRTLESSYKEIMKDLKSHNVTIKGYPKLSDRQKEIIKDEFFEQIYPVIMPIAIDATHPFPHLNNLSFALALKFEDRKGNIKHGLIRIPRILPRFLEVGHCFVPIESVVDHFSTELFSGFKRVSSTPFRVTRNADIEIEEEEADDFMEMLEEGIRSRNRGTLVRLELMEGADEELVEFLTTHLKLDSHDIYYYKIPLNLGTLWHIVGQKKLAHLTLPTYTPKTLPPFDDNSDIFEAIEKKDVLLYHPYESFDPIVNFIEEASKDPNTLSMRMTLYRVGKNSPIVDALIRASQDGKQVTVLVELKARFDEENNLHWAKALEDAGAHVIYGITGLKVHAKIAQITKRKGSKLQSYLHLGTGNYNPTTSRIYTDMSYFTTKKEFNQDATKFFHFITGFSDHTTLKRLIIAPTDIKPKLISLIEEESSHKEKGFIILKANSLVDPDIIQALYKASMKGCKIELIIRGICTLKPAVDGVSDNISVYSIIGKYLEHPRIYYFKHDKNECYISSADLMPRNLIRRIEIMTPIVEPHLQKKIKQILSLQLQDSKLRWKLKNSGEYKQVKQGDKIVNNHDILEEFVTKIYDKAQKDSSEYINKRVLKGKK